jgi:hypothetical protein
MISRNQLINLAETAENLALEAKRAANADVLDPSNHYLVKLRIDQMTEAVDEALKELRKSEDQSHNMFDTVSLALTFKKRHVDVVRAAHLIWQGLAADHDFRKKHVVDSLCTSSPGKYELFFLLSIDAVRLLGFGCSSGERNALGTMALAARLWPIDTDESLQLVDFVEKSISSELS